MSAKRSKQDVKKLIVRIICLILAVLMVGGVLYSFIYSLAFSTVASEDDTYISVGLYWGTSSQGSYTLTSGGGFLVGELDSLGAFTEKSTVTDSKVSVSAKKSDLTEGKTIVLLSTDGSILYECDEASLCIKPVNKNDYMSIEGSYTYGGVFKFTRNTDNSMKLINVVELEEYVLGVLPNEISSYYPAETKKAFAVTVRSYTISSIPRHSSNGFDICNTTHCQVYRGRRNVDQGFIDAVEGSKGMVMAYNKKTVQAYYSAITGGTTCGVYETWGSESDYLKAIATPWEKYQSSSNGVWTAEYTPAELYERLKSRGYDLSGSIADVRISQLAENSTYVYKLDITDTSGKTITITRADKIRTALGLNSANFVCGKAGDTVERINYLISESDPADLKVNVMTSGGEVSATDLGSITVATADGNKTTEPGGQINVRAAYGDFTVSAGKKTWSSELEKMLNAETIPVTEQITLSGSEGSFVFEGRGWGHGVGMSQTGARDLGNLGADYKTILTTYFPGISVVDYKTVS